VPEDLAEKDTFSPYLACVLQALLCLLACTIRSCPIQKAFCVLTRGALREHIFVILKSFDIEDTVTLSEGASGRGLKFAFCRCGCADFHSGSPFIKWESPSFILADDLGPFWPAISHFLLSGMGYQDMATFCQPRFCFALSRHAFDKLPLASSLSCSLFPKDCCQAFDSLWLDVIFP